MKDIPVGRQIGLGAGLFVAAWATSLMAILFFGWKVVGRRRRLDIPSHIQTQMPRSGSLGKDEKIEGKI